MSDTTFGAATESAIADAMESAFPLDGSFAIAEVVRKDIREAVAVGQVEALNMIPKHPRSTDGEFLIVPAAWFDDQCVAATARLEAIRGEVKAMTTQTIEEKLAEAVEKVRTRTLEQATEAANTPPTQSRPVLQQHIRLLDRYGMLRELQGRLGLHKDQCHASMGCYGPFEHRRLEAEIKRVVEAE